MAVTRTMMISHDDKRDDDEGDGFGEKQEVNLLPLFFLLPQHWANADKNRHRAWQRKIIIIREMTMIARKIKR